MKQTIKKVWSRGERLAIAGTAICAAALFFVAIKAAAQTIGIGSPATVQGTTNSPPVATFTNAAVQRPLTCAASGGTNAATTVTFTLYASLNGTTNGAFAIETLTTNVGTATFSTVLPATNVALPLSYFIQVQTGTNTENTTVIYGP